DDVPLQDVAQAEEHGHCQRQADERVDARQRPQEVGQVRGQHDEGRVCQVDDVENAPDQREPQSDQGEDAALQQAVQDVLDEVNIATSAHSTPALATAP